MRYLSRTVRRPNEKKRTPIFAVDYADSRESFLEIYFEEETDVGSNVLKWSHFKTCTAEKRIYHIIIFRLQ